MNKNIAEIINALAAHEDNSSIQVLEELVKFGRAPGVLHCFNVLKHKANIL